MSSSKLFLEGDADRLFFQALVVEKLGFSVDIEPKHGISNIQKSLLEKKLFKKLQTGQIEHLGIIADADHATTIPGKAGFQNRWQELTEPLRAQGYEITDPPSQTYQGSIFTHPDGLPPVGLWLMPDHQNDGMLEDLIKQTIDEPQQSTLLQAATTCLDQLPCTLFEPHHQTKATVYTWLAWQKKPGQALVSAINANLINLQSPPWQEFITWLNYLFKEITP